MLKTGEITHTLIISIDPGTENLGIHISRLQKIDDEKKIIHIKDKVFSINKGVDKNNKYNDKTNKYIKNINLCFTSEFLPSLVYTDHDTGSINSYNKIVVLCETQNFHWNEMISAYVSKHIYDYYYYHYCFDGCPDPSIILFYVDPRHCWNWVKSQLKLENKTITRDKKKHHTCDFLNRYIHTSSDEETNYIKCRDEKNNHLIFDADDNQHITDAFLNTIYYIEKRMKI